MSTILITGANRGIGFQLAKQFSADSKNVVIATTRSFSNAGDLKGLGRDNVHVIELDITGSLDSIKKSLKALNEIAPKGVDVVVQNAGTWIGANENRTPLTAEPELFSQNFEINTMGSIKFYQAVYPYWAKNTGKLKKFIFVSSALGWINNYLGITSLGYGISKAAVNFFVKEISHLHAQSNEGPVKNSVTVAIHPGLVATDLAKELIALSGISDYLTPEQCGEKLKTLFDGLTPEDNGKFKNYTGDDVLW